MAGDDRIQQLIVGKDFGPAGRVARGAVVRRGVLDIGEHHREEPSSA